VPLGGAEAVTRGCEDPEVISARAPVNSIKKIVRRTKETFTSKSAINGNIK
jgi:hypothetical protein